MSFINNIKYINLLKVINNLNCNFEYYIMSLVNLRLLPRNSFTSIVFPFLKTYYEEMSILEQDIKIGECHFNIKNQMLYDYKISQLNKTTKIFTIISTNIDKIDYKIYEQISVKRNQDLINTCNYTNYSVNIVNSKDYPYIHSMKCVGQPISVDLTKFYTEEIKEFHNIINKKLTKNI